MHKKIRWDDKRERKRESTEEKSSSIAHTAAHRTSGCCLCFLAIFALLEYLVKLLDLKSLKNSIFMLWAIGLMHHTLTLNEAYLLTHLKSLFATSSHASQQSQGYSLVPCSWRVFDFLCVCRDYVGSKNVRRMC